MPDSVADLSLLSAMITPAVLISACGTLIFSTSSRLGRIVDRVRELSVVVEQLYAGAVSDFPDERRDEVERQIASHAQRGRLIQRSLTSFYLSLGLFVATTISIGVTAFAPQVAWLPTALGVVGTVALFHGSVMLIRETRLALHSVDSEMAFVLRLGALYQSSRPSRTTGPAEPARPSRRRVED
jgi:hypothetical protein